MKYLNRAARSILDTKYLDCRWIADLRLRGGMHKRLGIVTARFWRQGYAVIPQFAAPQQVDSLLQRTKDIIDNWDMDLLPTDRVDELSAICQNGAGQ